MDRRNEWARYPTQKREKIRAKILKRDQGICAYCDGPATTVDHIVPTSKGGALLDEDNMVAACRSCNSRKSNRDALFLDTPRTPDSLTRYLSPTKRKPAESPFEPPEASQ